MQGVYLPFFGNNSSIVTLGRVSANTSVLIKYGVDIMGVVSKSDIGGDDDGSVNCTLLPSFSQVHIFQSTVIQTLVNGTKDASKFASTVVQFLLYRVLMLGIFVRSYWLFYRCLVSTAFHSSCH